MSPSDTQPWYTAVQDRTSTRAYAVSSVIAFQGEAGQKIGYVLSGRAKAISFSENGEATWVGYFRAGDFFGHTDLLSENPPPFEIIAETEVKVLFVTTETMKQLLSEQGSLSLEIAKDLASRLDEMTHRLIEAFTLSAKGRICAELARLSRVIGNAPDTRIIRPNPVFVELAERVNSTRETVSRTVSDLQKKGVLAREPGAIIITQPERLRQGIR
ncbi:MAG: Crp/Fnr family transcriptional regulator [Litorimonas sp.]